MTLSSADSPDNPPLSDQTNDAYASEPLIDHVDNLDAQADTAIDEEGAKAPASKITMTSPSPDVVIASVETSDPNILDAAEQNTNNAENKAENALAHPNTNVESMRANGVEENQSALSDNSSQTPDNDLPDTSSLVNDVSTEGSQPFDDENSANEHTDNLAEDSAAESDEIQEQKEAKLESYKQFVAEQFSNQKVDYPEVRVKIEANALPSRMYFVMNILSAIIASYGLVTNSAAVVIGAMLVAMMLGPITGVALAIIDHRMPLLRKSLFTVAAGVSIVVLVGFVVGWLHNDQPLTNEILSRTQPTSMDLMIALAGGTAGAYAMVSPHLSVAVVGVAVATALVPPLAASGILFANGEMVLGFGALLLAITNIIAIQFTNALVLWILGFRRLVDDDYKASTFYTFCRRNAVTLILLAVLGTYLSINLKTNAKQQTFESNVKATINDYYIDKGNVLTNTQFDRADGNQIVRAVIRGQTTPSSYDVRQIEAAITKDMDENFPDYLPIKIQLRYLPVQVIEANPLITDKLDKTDAAILTN